MIKYPKDYNPILEYWDKIQSGEEVVCFKVRRTYQKIVEDLNNNNRQYFYSPARANHVIEFIENYCRQSKGKQGGKPVKLELWEKAFLASTFGFIDIEGNREYTQVILIIGKKNGKSLLASCVGLYLMVADGEPGAEVYAVATKKDQAKIIWQEAKRMVRKSPVLRKRIKTLVGELTSDFNDATFKPLASESNTLDGLNVSGALFDEVWAWKNGKELFDIIADGTSARESPLILVTSTAGTIREDIYDQKYEETERLIKGYDDKSYCDEHTIAFCYELDNPKEWKDPKCWKKANPSLGVIKSVQVLADKVEKAKSNPMLLKDLLCKEFNIRETSSQSWLTFEQLNNEDTYVLEPSEKDFVVNKVIITNGNKEIKTIHLPKPRYGIGGLDLSTTTDLTCATVIFMVPGSDTIFVKQMFWLPTDLLDKRVKEDKIPYNLWMEQGLLRLSGTNKINYKDVTNWFLEMQNDYDIYIYKIGYDRWNSAYIVEELKQTFGAESTDEVIQGKQTESSPLKNMAADLDAKRINYCNDPITKWNLANAAINTDANANISLIKTDNPRMRIDGTASMMDAYIVLERNLENYKSII